MALTLPTGVYLYGDDLRLVADALLAFQREAKRQGVTDLNPIVRAEQLSALVSAALPASAATGGCQLPAVGGVTAAPLAGDLRQSDAVERLCMSERTFQRRARKLELEPAGRDVDGANLWRAGDVAAVGRA